MSARRLQLALSTLSLGIAAVILAIVLASIVQLEDGFSMDLSRGKGVFLGLSVAFLAVSAYLVIGGLRSAPAAPPVEATAAPIDEPAPVGAEAPHGAVEDDELEARISTLEPDERRLFDMIQEAGGEMLQMNVVSSKVFSKAKVTRLLDKLDSRGLIVRERHGMTNRIRIVK